MGGPRESFINGVSGYRNLRIKATKSIISQSRRSSIPSHYVNQSNMVINNENRGLGSRDLNKRAYDRWLLQKKWWEHRRYPEAVTDSM